MLLIKLNENYLYVKLNIVLIESVIVNHILQCKQKTSGVGILTPSRSVCLVVLIRDC